MRERKSDTPVVLREKKERGKWKNDSKRRKKPADRVRKHRTQEERRKIKGEGQVGGGTISQGT